MLSDEGKIFVGFPPWQMPFGGHQQICDHAIPAVLPYIHLLPKKIYKRLLRLLGEKKTVPILMETKETGLSIERLERIIRTEDYRIEAKRLYLFNPIYKSLFGIPTLRQLPPIAHIPYVRDFLSTCAYYLISPQNKMRRSGQFSGLKHSSLAS
jgi:hypothetical protein